MKKLLLLLTLGLTSVSFGQFVQETFSDTRVINGHSTETLKKNVFQVRIEHRFGDAAGTNGGIQQWFGFDQAADIRFGFEYGIMDNLMVGLGRSKGTGAPYRSLIDGFVKYRFLSQGKEGGSPVSVAFVGSSTFTYMPRVNDISQVASFPDWQHRLAYNAQLLVARKFGERLSLQIMPTYVHRNFVDMNDVNGVFAMGGAFNLRITKSFSFITEYYHVLSGTSVRNQVDAEGNSVNGFHNSLGVAAEFATNGHTFKINFTNSRGFNETQFIPYTYSDWLEGQFRIGFSITRNFKF